MKLEIPDGKLIFTCGWTITKSEADIRKIPEGAWKPGVDQDGHVQEDTHVAEITGLMSRAGNWPDGLRWIIRRVKPSRRHLKKLTACEKEAGWKYSIICTSIPEDGIEDVPGNRHAQFIDVLHRQHAVVEDGVRTGKAAGLRNLPYDPGGSTAAGPSPRTSPPTCRHGAACWAFTTRMACQTPSRTRSATAGGTFPPGSSATPAARP